jgi:WD40 repeat protein
VFESVERIYTLIKCLIRRFKAYGIELSAGFYKEHFKDLLTLPSGTPIATLRGHTDWVTCLIARNNILYSGSDDRTIRAWNLDTNECITALQGHTRGVYRLIAHNNILYSGSGDKTIRAWSLDTNECITALQEHTGVVRCLIVHNNMLYSGSVDKTIRAWKL